MTEAGRRVLATAIAAVVLAALVVPAAVAATDETILVSRQSAADGGAGGDANSLEAAISADGRYVAFESDADNLSTADNNTLLNVFVRDTQTNATTLVSRQSTADGGAGADGASLFPAISADGRYVAFYSGADNLSGDDNNAVMNVFVRDTQTSVTTLVSRQSTADGGAGADGASILPAISADGRYVAFDSNADNLSGADNNANQNVFVRDTQTNVTTLVSRQSAADGGAGGDGGSGGSAISADGRYVAFDSSADNLSGADNNTPTNVFVRDTQTDVTTHVSRQSATDGGAGGDGDSAVPAISADGRHVAFRSLADNLSGADNNANVNIFVHDTQTNATTLVSRQSAADGGAGADGNSLDFAISADGRHVAFSSGANNLSDADSSALDTFVRDTQLNLTTLVSRQSAADGGAGADGTSITPAISADGRYVAFESGADNLSGVDNNAYINVFVRDVPEVLPAVDPPTDPPIDPPIDPPANPPVTPPSNQFTFGKVKLNKKKGTAKLTVTVPGPGELALSGPGLKAQRPVPDLAAKPVTAAGDIALTIKPAGNKKKKLKKKGKVKVKAAVSFSPTGGTPATQTKSLKLKRKRKH